MPKQSAGILLYRLRNGQPQFFLVHPGGPFWSKKDLAAWSIPKGEFIQGDDPLENARREFMEETGSSPDGPFIELAPVRQKGGKLVHCFAAQGDIDPLTITSNTFYLEWPPKSGKMQSFPEADKAGWFDADTARAKINEAQGRLIDELLEYLATGETG